MADVGRPTVMTEATLQKLEDAYTNDATDEQACFLANIGTSTLYKYQEEHPEFVERKHALKNNIKYRAKMNIKKAIEENDKDITKWYLERKDKEFKPKSDITSDDEAIQPVLVKFLDEKSEDNRNTDRVQETV